MGMKEESSAQSENRWMILIACVAAMLAVANVQYAWTLFTKPLQGNLQASKTAIQVAFSTYVIMQTWLQPVEAYFVDRFGARIVVSIGALLVAAGWIGSGLANSLTTLYVAYGLAGVGVGIVYGACIGMATKWFPDRRGLVVGVTAGAFGAGTALTVLPISGMIVSRGYQATFITFGILQGIVVLLAAQFMRMPVTGYKPPNWDQIKDKLKSKVQISTKDYTPREMMKTAPFYVLYLMMTMVAFGGLTITAQLHDIGSAYKHDQYILFAGVSAFSFALMIEQVANGITRPFWGWVSDHIGRYNTMAIAFLLEALGLYALVSVIERPVWFAILTAATAFAWGEIYSLFPSAIADVFGSKYSTTNYGIQYTSKGVAALLAGPGAAALAIYLKNRWGIILAGAGTFDLIVAALAFFWLKPMVARLVSSQSDPYPVPTGIAPEVVAEVAAEVEPALAGRSST